MDGRRCSTMYHQLPPATRASFSVSFSITASIIGERFKNLRRYTWAFLVVLGLTAVSCSAPSRLDSPDAGRTHTYEPGLPNFDMEAIATSRDGHTGIDLYLSIPHVALVYAQTDGVFIAEYERNIRILKRDTGDLISEIIDVDSLQVTVYEETQSFRPFLEQLRVDVEAGEYVVETILTDLGSDKQAERRQGVSVVDLEGEGPFVSRMRIETKRPNEPFEPTVSLHIGSHFDSLRTVLELYNLSDEENVQVALRLLKYESDTTHATPPYWLTATRGSLVYRGVLFNRSDTLQVTRRRLERIDREAVVEFFLPQLSPGLYKIEVEARAMDDLDTTGRLLLKQERDLSIRNATFPEISLLDELVASLAYIAFENEIRFIQSATTQQEKKRRFDAFWGSLLPNRQAAANLINLYYSRVQEANLLFTSYKEGWRTDRGMLYIILGAPVYVENRLDSEIWHYTYNDQDPVNTYAFERVFHPEGEYKYDNYVLQRRSYYHRYWIRAIDRWREGVVL